MTNQPKDHQTEHGDMQAGDRQHMIDPGGGKSGARLFGDAAHVADHQRLEQRTVGPAKNCAR